MTRQQVAVLRASRALVAAWAAMGLAQRRSPYGGTRVEAATEAAKVAEAALVAAVKDLRGDER